MYVKTSLRLRLLAPLVTLGLGLGGCIYAPPPVAYAPPSDSYAYAPAPSYYDPYYGYSPYYYAPAYYPPAFGSVGFFFGGGGHHHFR